MLNPCFGGDTVRAWSEVLDKAEIAAPGIGALRLRLVATKGRAPFELRGQDGKYHADTLLDLDYWALIPSMNPRLCSNRVLAALSASFVPFRGR